MIVDHVYKSVFVVNDAKLWFRAASELLKEDQPGTLLVYTPWQIASVWKSAQETIGDEVKLKLEPTPMYSIEKPDGLQHAGNSSEQYNAVTMVWVAHRTGQAVPLCQEFHHNRLFRGISCVCLNINKIQSRECNRLM